MVDRAPQTSTVHEDINASLLDLPIELGQQVETGGGDRGAIDNIELSGIVEEVSALLGGFNNDGFVDAADFTVFRDNIDQDDTTLISQCSLPILALERL